jgi:hypothetical protein
MTLGYAVFMFFAIVGMLTTIVVVLAVIGALAKGRRASVVDIADSRSEAVQRPRCCPSRVLQAQSAETGRIQRLRIREAEIQALERLWSVS